MQHIKPRFGRFETWGACSRCGARVRYSTLARERLTGLLVCTSASGRPVKPCLDPWPPVFDFQVTPDRSIEPPAEPLPVRWGLDDIWSGNAMKMAPDDATRLQAFMKLNFQTKGSIDFTSYRGSTPPNQQPTSVVSTFTANYDGTFVPSNSVRTVVPPDPTQQMENVNTEPASGDQLVAPPWAVRKGI